MTIKSKKDTYCILFAILISFFQVLICRADSRFMTDSATKTLEIRIDPASASAGADAKLFDSIRYVPLETNRKSQFLAISQLEVSKNYYIILDGNLNTLFFFRKDGSFSHKLDKDNTNMPFKSISRFAIEKTNDILSFDDHMLSRTYTLDLKSNVLVYAVRNRNYRDYVTFNGYRLYYHLDDDFNFVSLVRYEEQTGKRLNSYLPADTARKNVSLSESRLHFYHSDRGNMLFTRPYDYSVYGLDSVAVPYLRYRFILPLSNMLPIDFLSNAAYHNRWNEYLRLNRSIIYSIQGVYQSGSWLTFNLFPNAKGGTFLYHLSTGDLFDMRKTEDLSTGLPIVERLSPVIGIDQGALISELPFLSLKRRYEELSMSERESLLPTHLRALMSRKSHNIILRLSYLKQNYSPY